MPIIDHIAIATDDLERSIAEYKKLFDVKIIGTEKIESQSVEVVFIETGESAVEFIAPLNSSSSKDSALQRFLVKRGPGLHHIAYRVPDIVAELARLQEAGIKAIDTAPRPGFNDSKIAFLHPKSCNGVLTELVQV